ncbi:MAG: DapH/DapD/GlmU-related protein [Escherichia coli]
MKPVILKKGCWIGANVTILPGVVVGENSVVGANSVVTKSISPFTVVAGNPAKIIKKLNE